MVARALHRASSVANKPLVVINCAALPEALLESELFGHERGAFTGAVAEKQGLFEVADGGTLFIDEIGELAGGLQAKLLRVLEDGMLRRVGSVKESRVQVRLLAATNRDLAQEVAAGRFREDLYYRINVLRIHLPPLRERKGDVRLLVEHLGGGEWQWSEELIRLLERYGWPGNVRQLQNALDRAKILADDEWILPEHLPPEILRASQGAPTPTPTGDAVDLETINRLHVTETLERCHGNKARTARAEGSAAAHFTACWKSTTSNVSRGACPRDSPADRLTSKSRRQAPRLMSIRLARGLPRATTMVAPSPTSPDKCALRRELRELLDSIAHRFATDPAQDPMLPSLLGCLVLHLEEEFHRADPLPNGPENRREQMRLLARANDLAAWSRRAGTRAEAWMPLAAAFAELHGSRREFLGAPLMLPLRWHAIIGG